MTNFKPLSEYKKDIGPGSWFMIHHEAELAVTPEKMKNYADNFRALCGRMDGCGCGGHCSEMLERRRPEDYFHYRDKNGVPDGCLRHSVDCHNDVNQRLGKPIYPYESVRPIWRPDGPPPPCTKGKSKTQESTKTTVRGSTVKPVREKHTKKSGHFRMVILDDA